MASYEVTTIFDEIWRQLKGRSSYRITLKHELAMQGMSCQDIIGIDVSGSLLFLAFARKHDSCSGERRILSIALLGQRKIDLNKSDMQPYTLIAALDNGEIVYAHDPIGAAIQGHVEQYTAQYATHQEYDTGMSLYGFPVMGKRIIYHAGFEENVARAIMSALSMQIRCIGNHDAGSRAQF